MASCIFDFEEKRTAVSGVFQSFGLSAPFLKNSSRYSGNGDLSDRWRATGSRNSEARGTGDILIARGGAVTL